MHQLFQTMRVPGGITLTLLGGPGALGHNFMLSSFTGTLVAPSKLLATAGKYIHQLAVSMCSMQPHRRTHTQTHAIKRAPPPPKLWKACRPKHTQLKAQPSLVILLTELIRQHLDPALSGLATGLWAIPLPAAPLPNLTGVAELIPSTVCGLTPWPGKPLCVLQAWCGQP